MADPHTSRAMAPSPPPRRADGTIQVQARKSHRLEELGVNGAFPWRLQGAHVPQWMATSFGLAARASTPAPRGARLVPRPAPLRAARQRIPVFPKLPNQPRNSMSDEVLFPMMYAKDQPSDLHIGRCSLCLRTMHNITRHHVHPRVPSRRGKSERAGPVGFTDAQLEVHIPACHPCHCLIHTLIPNADMGMNYYSANLLRSHPRVRAWANWVIQQPIPAIPIEGAGLPPTKRQLALQHKQERKSRKASMYAGQIRIALRKIWTHNGDTFPRWGGGPFQARTLALAREIKNLSGLRVDVPAIKDAMKPMPEYRGWYLWLFDFSQPDQPSPNAGRVGGATVHLGQEVQVHHPLAGAPDGGGVVAHLQQEVHLDHHSVSARNFGVAVAQMGQGFQAAVRGNTPMQHGRMVSGMEAITSLGLVEDTLKPATNLHEASGEDNQKHGLFIENALDKIWTENGGTFPRWTSATETRGKVLASRLQNIAKRRVIVPWTRRALVANPKYRAWYSWVFDNPDDNRKADCRAMSRVSGGAGAANVQSHIGIEVLADEDVNMNEEYRRPAQQDRGRQAQAVSLVRAALEKLWIDHGNTFPEWPMETEARGFVLAQRVEELIDDDRIGVVNPEIRRILNTDPKYRDWYKWVYGDLEVNQLADRGSPSCGGVGAATIQKDVDMIDGRGFAAGFEVIDLTADSSDADEVWYDAEDGEQVGRSSVIDLTGDGSDEKSKYIDGKDNKYKEHDDGQEYIFLGARQDNNEY